MQRITTKIRIYPLVCFQIPMSCKRKQTANCFEILTNNYSTNMIEMHFNVIHT